MNNKTTENLLIEINNSKSLEELTVIFEKANIFSESPIEIENEKKFFLTLIKHPECDDNLRNKIFERSEKFIHEINQISTFNILEAFAEDSRTDNSLLIKIVKKINELNDPEYEPWEHSILLKLTEHPNRDNVLQNEIFERTKQWIESEVHPMAIWNNIAEDSMTDEALQNKIINFNSVTDTFAAKISAERNNKGSQGINM